MRYMVRKSVIQVIGTIWMPEITAAMDYTLSDYDVRNIEHPITRETVEYWLALRSGDFRNVKDFHASIEDGDATIDIPWADEESECTYNDCMFPAED